MTETKTSPAAHLPLSAPAFQIQLSLCERPMHGYAILADIHARTDTTVELGAGTLYAAIKRMLAAGMVEECDPPADAEGDDSRRRYYDISRYGREVAAAEAARLQRLTVLAQDRHLIPNLIPAPAKKT